MNKEDEERYTDLVLREGFSGASEFLKGVKKLAASHMTYDRIKNIVERNGSNINGFYIFTIDRHPYSWLISQCLYSNEKYNSGALEISSIGVEEINRRVLAFLKRGNVSESINMEHVFR
ncbi:hypothetical protein [Halomonas nitroreducens]|uniref:Uncharacterized protein n=1 Tax=Halomonas nitroreducens TaxID=447425 RepID=A0A3S0HLX2_9GAMM|nr:hypothetical protein [Halomonas nitroreducens]RTQ97099.1 hypothetical protein EKG36_20355 [Halomonas nitroreducens]